ncbi:MAG: hypothetical protein ACLTXT_06905 [Ruminococcus callidus]
MHNQSECNDQADDVYNTVAGASATGEQVAQLVYDQSDYISETHRN